MSTTNDEKRGRAMQVLRQSLRITQDQAAEQLRVTTQTVYNLERGIGWAQIDTVADLCDIYQISVSDLAKIIETICGDKNLERMYNKKCEALDLKKPSLKKIRQTLKTDDMKVEIEEA
jgi:transcriptional regulator with XRE-family HTH domain